ncbi:hypothetical protein K439DRAFT_1621818 [Ramaria rubella]|nr:hypothetical protein K439DRAFT_1621818 [Ramaria rubella]
MFSMILHVEGVALQRTGGPVGGEGRSGGSWKSGVFLYGLPHPRPPTVFLPPPLSSPIPAVLSHPRCAYPVRPRTPAASPTVTSRGVSHTPTHPRCPPPPHCPSPTPLRLSRRPDRSPTPTVLHHPRRSPVTSGVLPPPPALSRRPPSLSQHPGHVLVTPTVPPLPLPLSHHPYRSPTTSAVHPPPRRSPATSVVSPSPPSFSRRPPSLSQHPYRSPLPLSLSYHLHRSPTAPRRSPSTPVTLPPPLPLSRHPDHLRHPGHFPSPRPLPRHPTALPPGHHTTTPTTLHRPRPSSTIPTLSHHPDHSPAPPPPTTSSLVTSTVIPLPPLLSPTAWIGYRHHKSVVS